MFVYIFNLYFVLIMLYLSRKLLTKKITENSSTWSSRFYLSRSSGLFITFAFCSMFFISGLRYNVGTDYQEYINLFHSIANKKEILFSFQIEPVFVIIIKTIYLFSSNPVWMFVLTSFFITFFIYRASIKSAKFYDLAIFLFIAFGFYTSSFNTLRQWMAVSVMLYAYTFLIDNKQKQFLKYAILATLCHYSALVVFPMYFFITIIRNNITRIVIMFSGIFLFYITNQIVPLLKTISIKITIFNKYAKYLDLGQDIAGNVFVMPMFCVITFLLYIFFWSGKRAKINKHKKDAMEIYINILSLGFVFSLIGQKLMVFSRLQFFFVIILILIIPQILSELKKEERILFYLAIIFMGTIFMVYGLNQNGGHPLPYQTIF